MDSRELESVVPRKLTYMKKLGNRPVLPHEPALRELKKDDAFVLLKE